MRTVLFGLTLTTLALALAATATGTPAEPAQTGSCAKANLNLIKDGQLSLATDNPAFPPWWGGAPKKPWEVSNPASGKGYESAVAYAVAKQLGFSKSQVAWSAVPFNNSFRPGKKPFDFYMAQVSFAREGEERLVLELVLLRQPGRRRERGHADLARRHRGRSQAVQARRPGRHDELRLHREHHSTVAGASGVRLEQRRDLGAQRRTRSTASSSTSRLRSSSSPSSSTTGRSSESSRSAARASSSAWSSRRGTPS